MMPSHARPPMATTSRQLGPWSRASAATTSSPKRSGAETPSRKSSSEEVLAATKCVASSTSARREEDGDPGRDDGAVAVPPERGRVDAERVEDEHRLLGHEPVEAVGEGGDAVGAAVADPV